MIEFEKNSARQQHWVKRAVGRYENPGVPVLFGGHNLLALVKIGLTDLPKSGSATQKTKITEKVHKPLLGL